jgi:uncharacterized membrane protein (DUF2068 family)
VRGAILVLAGVVLMTHSHFNWAALLRDTASDMGVNPARHIVANAINNVASLNPHTIFIIGACAIGYGGLESVEGIGLLLRKLWAEYLTLIATAIFLPLEIWELFRNATLLKAGGFVVNIAVLAYLFWSLRRHRRSALTRHEFTAPEQSAMQESARHG